MENLKRLKYEIPPAIVKDVMHFLWMGMSSKSKNKAKKDVQRWMLSIDLAIKANEEQERKELEDFTRGQMTFFEDGDVPALPPESILSSRKKGDEDG